MATAKKPLTAAQFKKKVLQHLNFTSSQDNFVENPTAVLRAVCLTVNEVVYEKLKETNTYHKEHKTRSINYLSLEYLMGRMLSNNLHNLDLFDVAKKAVASLGLELEDIFEEGHDLALGNGGLGRLAACFLDSLATMDFNAVGYGIHYEHGLFKQQFHQGRQIETPDEWREYGNPWEVCRPEAVQEIPLFGNVETIANADGSVQKVWHPGQIIKGVPWDVPIVGYNSQTVNVLRLWESRASSHFDWDQFNSGDYQDAHAAQNQAETISKVLYPNDETDAGKELRFIQQYFFCACSIKDIIKRYQEQFADDWSHFAEQVVIQLNDTHPTIAILELMRTLIDEYNFSWDDAFALCRKIFAYTNHTLLPEALEKWSVAMFERVLPRHLEILYSINEFFLNEEVGALWPNDHQIRGRLSLIEEGPQKMVRMAHLCVVTSFKVNGVAQIHSDLVKSDLFPEFNQLYPGKLTNVTNGVTPRRWLKACNPELSALLDSKVKADWAKDLSSLAQVAEFADDANFQKQFMQIKHNNKVKLAEEILATTGVVVSPDAIFDVQIKRLHEYKRQHLSFLHILALYRRLLDNPDYDMHPRVYIFGAKAAPGYYLAKEIIYAINKVADMVNNDERIKGKLKVVFMPNYRVTLAEKIIPAADVSEQISTAGKEASGTGNMKLALNGAVTIGTLDGANVEIAEEVGDDNIFIFGNTVDDLRALNAKGYNPYEYYSSNEEIKACLDWLHTDYFTPGKPGELAAISRSLLEGGDPYRLLADYDAYAKANIELDKAYKDKKRWARMAIINTAKMGKFTSDRSIQDYVDNIWKLTPIKH
ncbi:glycogen/starch/alpha-glucan phosphorylase [Thalassomonas sp. M1454]|uniref:glycogen/starch/alpha-glucan phosphorylase n=1 Tax=Thalassomonas sp. M1454 TaxID=2594477 RepID=UPI00117C9CF2|nr:glycogen/starch/alpha-glucan phosphorylase [Thalassomonas sp. M1454]TRX58076.1 glycogen/starch/alpha-glucan phosphorylase [Thalassomonas sp. M1454]